MSRVTIRTSTANPQPGVVALIMLFAVANLVVPSLIGIFKNKTLALMLIGGLMSEFLLLTIWAAFGTDKSPRRLGWVSFLFVVACFTWLVGIHIPTGRPIPPIEVSFSLLVAFLFMVLATAAGFFYRSATGQVLCYRDRLHRHPGKDFQFSIKQILGWTTGVALILTMSRFIFDTNFPSAKIWIAIPGLIGMTLLYCVQILVVAGACLELALGRGSRIKSFAVLVLAVPAVALLATMLAFAFGIGNRAGPATEIFRFLFVLLIGLSTTTTLALTWVRWIGFRLVRMRDEVKR